MSGFNKMRTKIFSAHSLENEDETRWQPLSEHLISVGLLAGARGEKFGTKVAAVRSGLLHDLGKYTQGFQNRLHGGERVDHSTAGAVEILKAIGQRPEFSVMAQLVAHCIAGHHAGLPDSLGDLAHLRQFYGEIVEFDMSFPIKPAESLGFSWRRYL